MLLASWKQHRLKHVAHPVIYVHGYHAILLRFLNHPANLVSFGMETDLETFDEVLEVRSSGDDMTSPSSWRRSEEDANFLSRDML